MSWIFKFSSGYSTEFDTMIQYVISPTRWYHINDTCSQEAPNWKESLVGHLHCFLQFTKVLSPTSMPLRKTYSQLSFSPCCTDSPYENVQKKIMMCQECSNPVRKENSRSSRSQHGSSSELDAEIQYVDTHTRWCHLNKNHIAKKLQTREGKFGRFVRCSG